MQWHIRIDMLNVRQMAARWNLERNGMELYKHAIYSIPQMTSYMTLMVLNTAVFDSYCY
jgi:hypothetical protein